MKNIAILAGGYSGESIISMQSAATVSKHLDLNLFKPYTVVISKDSWVVETEAGAIPIDKNDFSFTIGEEKTLFHGVFMAIHGPPGEDGKLQGYFDTLNIPYNCSDVFSASLTFNKVITNRFLKQAGVPSAVNVLLKRGDAFSEEDILNEVGLPCFVKPNGSGSSLGISKVNHTKDLGGAIQKAFAEDEQILIESFLEGTEVTCGCHLGPNGVASIAVTEIVSENDFFDYEAKYHDDKTQEITPARISKEAYTDCMRLTEKIYGLLHCKGMIRVDYILQKDGLYVIEVNTVPGLSEMSLIPKMVAGAGWNLKEFFTNSVQRMFD